MQLELKFSIFTFSVVVFILLHPSTPTTQFTLDSNEIFLQTRTVSGEENDDKGQNSDSVLGRAITTYIGTEESWKHPRRGRTLRDRNGLVYL
jgi:hypothetical protein